MRKVIISTVFMLLFSSICHALTRPELGERWQYFFNNRVYMAYIDSQNYSSFYYTYIDKNNVIHKNHHIIATWKWMAYHSQYANLAPKGAAYTLEYIIYDINCKITKVSRVIHYDKKDIPISDSEYTDFVFTVVPGTIGEEEIEAIIKYDSVPHNTERVRL